MCTESMLALADGPDVEIVKFSDTGNLFDIILNVLDIVIVRGAFHEHVDAALKGWYRCEYDDNGENVSADGVSNGSIGPEVDDNGCDDDTN